jgi:hypothetical protein
MKSYLLIKAADIDVSEAMGVCEIKGGGDPHMVAHSIYAGLNGEHDFLNVVMSDLMYLIDHNGECNGTETPAANIAERKKLPN